MESSSGGLPGEIGLVNIHDPGAHPLVVGIVDINEGDESLLEGTADENYED